VAAARLGRRWLLVDRNPAAVEIARARLATEAGS
jgi:DNA modification methylase